MRLTIINQYYTPEICPTARLAAAVAEHRAAAGDHVTVIASSGGYVPRSCTGDTARLRHCNPTVHRIPHLPLRRWGIGRIVNAIWFSISSLIILLTIQQQDVIVSMTTPGWIVLVAALYKRRHRKTRLVLWNMDCFPDMCEIAGWFRPGGRLSRVLRGICRRVFRFLDYLICPDRIMVDRLLAAYRPADRDLPVAIIPNWEPMRRFPQPPPATRKFADQHGLDGHFIVLYMGNAGHAHRFDTVIAAAKRLHERRVTFLFIGDGVQRQRIEATAAAQGLSNIRFLGHVPEEKVNDVLGAADAGMITLRDEALGAVSPSKLHTKLAAALPVIYLGPAGSNVDEAIRHHRCGLSIRHGQVDRFVECIEHLMSDPAVRRDMGQRARKAFEHHFTERQTLPCFDAVFEQLTPPDSQHRTADG